MGLFVVTTAVRDVTGRRRCHGDRGVVLGPLRRLLGRHRERRRALEPDRRRRPGRRLDRGVVPGLLHPL
ncbi:hypothetical protein [Nocardioides sp. B-3]|uniref:hypothetical protein n=1 Tax=Nocardioides sp. B-3 TaxID=2895565 RepID=UPI002152D5E4|nr:hypothetical protein [Nocardioides sp. B-3]UUZ60359.1 hypothetical protein LP418_05470 [Nocardioides sp. B-3]